MAELPVEIEHQPIVAQIPAPQLTALPGPDFLKGVGGLPVLRQLLLMVLLAGSVALGVYVVQWMTSPEYKPLSEVNSLNFSDVADLLDSNNIGYRLDNGLILVASDKIHEARMAIARTGLINGSQSGFELLDEEQGFGVSQFSEKAKHVRALQGEIAKSIETIESVRSARVLLNIPKPSGFLRDQREPTASVTLALAGNYQPSPQQVRAITNLVAGSVSGLTEGNVSVVSQSGLLLSQDSDDSMRQSNQQLEYVRSFERELQDKLHRQLGPVLGGNNFTAEVTAEMDFTWVEQTDELYNSDLPALRSEHTLEKSQAGGTAAGGVPGALSNQPPGAATTPETLVGAIAGVAGVAGSSSAKNILRETTRNNELDRTISHTRHQAPVVKRLTVSVFVDDKIVLANAAAGDADAAADDAQGPGYRPWTDAELEALTISLQTTVGYDPGRSDRVTVQNISFPRVEVVEAPPLPIWAEPWFLSLAKVGLGAIILLLITFVVLRPLFKSLAKTGEEHSKAVVEAAMFSLKANEKASQQAIAGPGGSAPAIGLADSPEYMEKVAAVRSLVADNPARVAQVVKQWASEGE